VEEARRSAEDKIKGAEEESKRIVAEAEVQIRQEEETSRKKIAEESAKLAEDARQRAGAETERLRNKAAPNIDRAVEFILSKVMP
jgi:V/A-type H+-transporting ATPase subunit G/H